MKLKQIYTIRLSGMRFHVHLGVGDIERKVGVDIIIDVELQSKANLKAFRDDDVLSCVDYSKVYDEIKEAISAESNLIESLAYSVGEHVLKVEGILAAKVSVTKINPPVGADGLNANITIEVAK